MKKVDVGVGNPFMFNIGSNFFEIFELPCKFNISEEESYKRYIELQQKYHPDKFVKQQGNEYKDAVENTMLINRAYAVLKDPIKRAAYMLKLKNIDVESEKSEYKPNAEILSLAMEFAEEIDSATTEQISVINERVSKIYTKACEGFAINIDNENLQDAISNWFTMRYMERTMEMLNLL